MKRERVKTIQLVHQPFKSNLSSKGPNKKLTDLQKMEYP